MAEDCKTRENERETKALGGWVYHRGEMLITIAMGTMGGVAIFVMMMLTVYDVSGRYLANHPLPGTIEISTSLFLVTVFLSLPFAEASGAHIKMDFLAHRLSSKWKDISDLFVFVVGFLCLGLLTWYAGKMVPISIAMREFDPGSFHVPLYPQRFIVAFGLCIFSLQLLLKVVGISRKVFHKRT